MIEDRSDYIQAEAGRPRPSLTAAIAIVTVMAISIGAIGALIAARHSKTAGTVISSSGPSSPTLSPSATPPVYLPGSAQVVAPSTSVAWVLMDYDALFRSTDQGNTWEKRSLPTPPGGIRPTITFIDDQAGWLLAPGEPASQCEEATADVWHTTDGAATWQHLNTAGIVKSQCKDGIWFVDARHGFITASDPNHPPTIYRTSDGGSTWAASTLPDPPDFKSAPAGFELFPEWLKASGATLYLEAYGAQDGPIHDRHYVFTSTDGGTAWKWLMKVGSASVILVTPSRWLDFSVPGRPMESVNGGQQFHQFASDLNPDSQTMQFVFAGATVGYASGNGQLQRTVDGGAHWVRIQTPGTQPLPSPSPKPSGIPMPTTAVLSAPSANVLWALVADAHLFRSDDQGTTWQEASWLKLQGGGAPLISFVDNSTGWALFPGVPATSCTSQGATLVQTNDGAITWHATANAINAVSSLPFNQCKDVMYFEDANRGWLATGDTVSAPKIWRTSDGGLSWSAASLQDSRLTPLNGPALRVASLKSFGNIVLASIPPYVYGSIDGGVTWAYITETRAASHAIGFVTSSRWIELISPDQSSETTDGGQTWHSLNTDYSQAAPLAPQIVFGDANTGYATVRGEIQRTADGGAHWEMIKNSWP